MTDNPSPIDDHVIILTGNRKKAVLPMLGWVIVVFCGMGLLVSIIMLMPNATGLRADKNGIEVTTLFRTHRIEWSDVERFYVGYISTGLSRTKMIAIEYSASYRKQAAGRRVASELTGMEGGLPDSYTLPAEEVCRILNEAKQRWDGAG